MEHFPKVLLQLLDEEMLHHEPTSFKVVRPSHLASFAAVYDCTLLYHQSFSRYLRYTICVCTNDLPYLRDFNWNFEACFNELIYK